MSTMFSIGEIAKLFNISTQTLRLYDRIGLLKPSCINEKTGYRYYSINQFVNLECILRCRAVGFSLDEIKQLIGNDSSIEAMLELTKKQKKSIRQKIEELELLEKQLDIYESKIKDATKVPFEEINVVYHDERMFKKYKENFTSEEELELGSRSVVLDIEEEYSIHERNISFMISYDEVLKYNKVLFKSILVEVNHVEKFQGEDIIKLPAGRYLTIYFADSTLDNRKYHNKMIKYIKENNIKVSSDFLETAMLLRVNKDGDETTLAKLEILCE